MPNNTHTADDSARIEASLEHDSAEAQSSPQPDTMRARTVREVTRLLSRADCASLRAIRQHPLPSPKAVERIAELGRRLIFPDFFGESSDSMDTPEYALGVAASELAGTLESQIAAALCFDSSHTDAASAPQRARRLACDFMLRLPELRRMMMADVHATYEGDPAASSVEEVIFSYPGIRATLAHRMAHELMVLGVPVIPRMLSELAHSATGIDIHPGASIGEGLMIDHGTGVVVGATAVIGRNVKLYQGVTLGARSFVRDSTGNPVKGLPRHPVVGDDVVIYANTTLLGRITIGRGAVIGGNLWVTADVAPGVRLVQARPDNTGQPR